jgi:pyruvate kinase
MLSGETAIGKYPVEAVRTMVRIGAEVEAYRTGVSCLQTDVAEGVGRLVVDDAVARAAAETAENLGARLIVASTQSGWTAKLVSKCRASVPVIAATPLVATARRCSLYWGVTPLLVQPTESTDAMIEAVEDLCRRKGLVEAGDTIVITAGSPLQPGTTDTLKVRKVGIAT